MNSLLDTAVVPIQKIENMKPSNMMVNTGQKKPTYFSLGGNVSPEVQLAEPPPINLNAGGKPNAPGGVTVVPVSKTVAANTYSGDTVDRGIANLVDNDPILTPGPMLERKPKVNPFDMIMMEPQFPFERNIEPIKKMDPQLQMILQAQLNTTGLIGLMNKDYRGTV
tara:strand:+ start:1069 stop:1566 length:498 start_codon:yes stop_codon:yes gene_type:complete